MTDIETFAVKASRRYLHSVVFVDDQIYADDPAPVPLRVDVPVPTRSMMFAPEEQQEVVEPNVLAEPVGAAGPDENEPGVEHEQGDVVFHPKHLVTSFAREGMVCALYEPTRGFSTDSTSDVFKLCDRADVVILDWTFHGISGAAALSLLLGLVSESETSVPHQVRLCAIYTTTPNLTGVLREIYEHLVASDMQPEIGMEGEFALVVGATRIVVLGKPTTARPKDQKAVEIPEVLLADRIIVEFARINEGILPSLALHGLASVRANSKKVLNKFRRNLDGAFLVHRALVMPETDAFRQVPELLAEEALAIMVDESIASGEVEAVATEVIEGMKLLTRWRNKSDTSGENGEYPKLFLRGGLAEMKGRGVEVKPPHLARLHEELDAGGAQAAMRLAALFATRTQYGPDRFLEFGTVVRETDTGEDGQALHHYAVCLMPLCDCVRLKVGTEYQFPFWRLRTSHGGVSSKGIVVKLPDGEEFVELFSLGKPREQLWMDEFVAGQPAMVQAEGEDGIFRTAKSGRSYRWVAQLKPEHAQRIAHDVGASLTRVAVLEAEWLRLKADSR